MVEICMSLPLSAAISDEQFRLFAAAIELAQRGLSC